MQHPDTLAEGLRHEQAEAERANSALRERLAIIEARLADTQNQPKRLLDLYLQGDFPKEVLTERKLRLEQEQTELSHERTELSVHLRSVFLTDDQIADIESFCAEVRAGLDNATFEDKRRYLELLDVRGRLALENGEKVVYVKCKLGEQRLLQIPTLPLSNTGGIAITRCVCRRTRRCR